MRTLWKNLDLIAQSGAARITLRKKLGDEFEAIEKFLRPVGIAEMIPDDDMLHVLEIEERPDGRLFAWSAESPPHRAPFEINRTDATILVPDIPKLRDWLAADLGFIPNTGREIWVKQFIELGVFRSESARMETVYLYFAGHGARGLELLEGFLPLHAAHVILATANALDFELRQKATERDLRIHILEIGAEMAPVKLKRGRKAGSIERPRALIPKRPGRTWGDLTLTIDPQGLGYMIDSARKLIEWPKLANQPRVGKVLPGVFQPLIQFARTGVWIVKKDDSVTKSISDLRRKLKALFPIEGDPIVPVTGGYQAAFHLHVDAMRLRKRSIREKEENESDYRGR
jgi:hypothetical protein